MNKINTNLSDEILVKIIDFCNAELSFFDKLSSSRNPNISEAKKDFSQTVVKKFIDTFSNDDLDKLKNNKNFDFHEISIICFSLKKIIDIYYANKKNIHLREFDSIDSFEFIEQLRFILKNYDEVEERTAYQVSFEVDGELIELDLRDENNITTLSKEIKQQMLAFQKENNKNFDLLSREYSKLKDEFKELKQELSMKDIKRLKEEIVSSMIAIFPFISYLEKIKNIFLINSKNKKIKLISDKINF
jgi:hypothetical protein